LFILLYVAPVLGTLFFASSNATLSLAAVYAACAVTLLLRPVGSALFGHYADVHGRQGAKARGFLWASPAFVSRSAWPH
jgi:MFS transporter, MHS family, proline/betaine transporter